MVVVRRLGFVIFWGLVAFVMLRALVWMVKLAVVFLVAVVGVVAGLVWLVAAVVRSRAGRRHRLA